MLNRYGNAEKFLTMFNPRMQSVVSSNPYYVYKGEAPQMIDVARAYGHNIAESWLEIQINDLSEYSGCKSKLTHAHIENTAKVIMSEFGYLKVSEFMYFFHRFKSGRYGKFYGAVDPLVITTSLQEFVRERDGELTRIANEYKENRKRIEDIKAMQEVNEFKAALKTCNMKVEEWLAIEAEPRLTSEEIKLMGWTFRLTPTKAATK